MIFPLSTIWTTPSMIGCLLQILLFKGVIKNHIVSFKTFTHVTLILLTYETYSYIILKSFT